MKTGILVTPYSVNTVFSGVKVKARIEGYLSGDLPPIPGLIAKGYG